MKGPTLVREGARGCGRRKIGGLYLVASGPGRECGALPVLLGRCPTCSAGIKPSRGFTWIEPRALLEGKKCGAPATICSSCPFPRIESAGLIWIGEKFYPTPEQFDEEAARMGISRRVAHVPTDFVLGQTWIFLAHRHAVPCPDCDGVGGGRGDLACDRCEGRGRVAAIWRAYRPQRIEQVVPRETSAQECERLRRKGITPIAVEGAEADDGGGE